ncbi:pyruvate dehydrogenase E1 [Pigmentiphaga aceris]|uniref:Pyruvate dehydrogenase E1 n=1 Tax=Pigmentiphaga aceris TaxID=1940612 RepID=A0A5C0AW21_9BURK|nr:pyruvate dehydrogenase E1 [Pigmentiphaga aceris]QEI06425.1 pyruvate dehydrogenase E1 [Pigmentiphaga aceris]
MELPDCAGSVAATTPAAARKASAPAVPVPPIERFAAFALQANGEAMQSTMAFVRQLAALEQDPQIGQYIVPILGDAARVPDISSLFSQAGLDVAVVESGQPQVDAKPVAAEQAAAKPDSGDAQPEVTDALSAWTEAATRHWTHSQPLLPFHISSSSFGFRDVGDLMGAATDARARGFLINMASSHTHLGSECPQQRDRASHLFASTLAHCRAYHPAFAGELAVIVDHGMRRMLMAQYDEFYYLTVTDDKLVTPNLPTSAFADVIRGMHLLRSGSAREKRVQLLGSGATMREVLQAAARLENDHGIAADIWSVTSYIELARQGIDQERRWRNGNQTSVDSWIEQRLAPTSGPIVAATDHGRALPELVRAFMPPGRRYVTLGSDGVGDDDAPVKVDASDIVQASLRAVEEIVCAERSAGQRQLAAVMSLSSI